MDERKNITCVSKSGELIEGKGNGGEMIDGAGVFGASTSFFPVCVK